MHLRPLVLLRVKPLQRVVAEFRGHVQVPVHRHGEDNIPNSVHFLLRGGNGAVRFFREQRPRCGNKFLHAAVDLAQYLFVHVRDIHTALPNGIARIAEVNAPIIEKCGELVVGMGEWNTDTLFPLRHNASLYPMEC